MAVFATFLPLFLLIGFSASMPTTLKKSVEQIGGFVLYRVVDGKIEYLLLKKTKENDWSPPKGNLEGTESTIDTAVRETREETGYLVNYDYHAYIQYKVYFEYETKDEVLKQVHLWPAELSNFDKPIELSPEHSEYAWLEYAEALATVKKQYRQGITAGDAIIRDHEENKK